MKAVAPVQIDCPAVPSRDELILQHLPQVKLIARRIHRGMPPSVSLDDVISAGTIGLIAAIDRYDSRQEVKLRTYAEYKIRGAILDSLRTLDWAPRQQRKRTRLIEKAIVALEGQHGRAATEEEIASELGLTLPEYHDWLAEARCLTLGSLDSFRSDDDSAGGDLMKYVADSPEEWPSRVLERSELQRLVAEAVARLPLIERTVLSLHYWEGATLREIAKSVDLHESRVSQLKSQSILRLRAWVKKNWPDQGAHWDRSSANITHSRIAA